MCTPYRITYRRWKYSSCHRCASCPTAAATGNSCTAAATHTPITCTGWCRSSAAATSQTRRQLPACIQLYQRSDGGLGRVCSVQDGPNHCIRCLRNYFLHGRHHRLELLWRRSGNGGCSTFAVEQLHTWERRRADAQRWLRGCRNGPQKASRDGGKPSSNIRIVGRDVPAEHTEKQEHPQPYFPSACNMDELTPGKSTLVMTMVSTVTRAP
jgi:hypothetical protein